ncbi:phosphopantetheine-binding protein [Cohnella zeiphila]|uniref:Acyl carrier protein n=1 Tax=Cohnella zeiphila TaxID=2761120 RepID=A0A7X0SJS8_9BACL|nr:phosphopantetheine-binding protein [Cohnella zeiphila]MBB6729990.1 acyl carrier protein [Cohnella zeiphila]
MTRSDILNRLKLIIAENLELSVPAETDESARLYDDLNIDSIMTLQLLVYVEESFGVAVPDEDIDPASFETLGGLVSFIERLLAAVA